MGPSCLPDRKTARPRRLPCDFVELVGPTHPFISLSNFSLSLSCMYPALFSTRSFSFANSLR